jgi:uncharacterized protein YhfF
LIVPWEAAPDNAGAQHCDHLHVPDPAPLPPYELGYAGTEMRRRLVEAVLRGDKTATSSLRQHYEPFTSDRLPRAGERFVLVGYSDEPRGTVEVTQVDVVALEDVDSQFAIDEGEGHTLAADWRAASLRYWASENVTGTSLVVCERFRLV